MYQPSGRGGSTIDSRKMLIERQPVIGTGDWDDIQCRYFTGEDSQGLKIGNIVLVREGGKILALCSISSDCFTDDPLTLKYQHEYFRNVKILDWYNGGETFPQIRSTLQRLTNPNTDSWQLINNWYLAVSYNFSMKELIDLLSLKHQIILQGPPGTGKTRKAKELATEMVIGSIRDLISDDFIRNHIKKDAVFASPENSNKFTILTVAKDSIKVYPKNANNEYSINFSQIKDCSSQYVPGDLVSKYNKSGNGSYVVSLSKYLLETAAKEHYKVIQFHPAYSYEDFVRGIEAKSNGNRIEYLTQDKTLVEFANLANQNINDHNSSPERISKRDFYLKNLMEFNASIEKQLEEQGEYALNNTVFICEIIEDAYKYTGRNMKTKKNWDSPPRNMKFNDIIEGCINNVKSQDEYKLLNTISGLAKQHSSYYYKLIEKFRETLKAKEPDINVIKEVPLKKYVLIIDEINRANLPAVLGELIYALEYRGESVESMYEKDGERKIIMPPNLYIIGTMNTADRSVGHIDYAIRRRFAFVYVLPKLIPELTENGKNLFLKLAKLFCKEFRENDLSLENSEYLATDFKPTDVMLGHSYFLVKDEERKNLNIPDDEILKIKLEYEVKPILREYLKDGVLLNSEKDYIECLSI